jgi:TPR repeat protein
MSVSFRTQFENSVIVALTICLGLEREHSARSNEQGIGFMAISQKSADFFLRSRMAEAEAGSVEALYELGVTYSTGRGGITVDLIEAHKWFNLAALSGDTRSQACRAEISFEMTAREIAEAQRQARAWLGHTGHQRHAA